MVNVVTRGKAVYFILFFTYTHNLGTAKAMHTVNAPSKVGIFEAAYMSH